MLVLGHSDRSASAIVTASSEVSSLPASFLQTPHISHRWRSLTGVTSASLTYDFGTEITFGIVVVRGSNLTDAATIRVEAANSSDFSTKTYDSLAQPVGHVWSPIGQIVKLVQGSIPSRYVRVTLSDSSRSYIEAGHVFIGSTWRPDTNFRYGYSYDFEDDSIVTKTIGSAVWVDKKVVARGISLRLDHILDTEIDEVMEILRTNGLSADVAVVLDSESSNLNRYTYVGPFRVLGPLFNRVTKYHGLQISVVERIA